ncbi:MAG: amidohydrolase [Pseudomonadota bacterium]
MRNLRVFACFVVLTCFLASPSISEASKIIHNVKGYTPTQQGGQTFDALLIGDDGRVLSIGTATSLFSQSPGAKRVDGAGATLIPGLIDSHAHVMGLGEASLQIDLRGTKSLDEALERVKAFAAENPDLAWIRGRGWNQEVWQLGRFPTAAELDKAVADRPVWLSRVDGHAAWANTRALTIASVSAETADPSGGEIIRADDGAPAGVFIDAAEALVARHIPPLSSRERRQAFTNALEIMTSVGITTVHDAGTSPQDWALFNKFAYSGKLTTRIYAMIAGTDDTFDRLARGGPIEGLKDDLLAMRSVKLYADGALGSRGAALNAAYSDKPESKGLLFNTDEELAAKVQKAASRGFQVNIHAIGDRANRQALDIFAGLPDRQSASVLRHRVEHAQIVDPADFERFASLGVIASVQPTHATSDKNMAETRLGPERIKGAYAWRRFLDAGVRIAAGSDFPVELPDPLHGIQAAVARTDLAGEPVGGWYVGEALTLEEAIRAFTLGGAYAAFWEDRVGSLEPGYWADFILLDQDIFAIPATEIGKIKVLETWLAGEQVYDRDKGAE